MKGQITLTDIFKEDFQNEWLYEIDNDYVMAKCPGCEKRMIMSWYQDKNYYKYCPYCGKRLNEGKYVSAANRIRGNV